MNLVFATPYKDRQRKLFNFINRVIRFKDPEIKEIFEKDIKQLNGRNTTMGIEEFLLEEARMEGEEKSKEQIVKNLIQRLGFTNKQAAEIAEVPTGFVQKVRRGLNKQQECALQTQ